MRIGPAATLLMIGLFLASFDPGETASTQWEGVQLQESVPGAVMSFPEVTSPDPVVEEMIGQVSEEAVRQYAGELSGEGPVDIDGSPYTITTRYNKSGTPIEKATRYAGSHLAANGLAVEYHVWGAATVPNVIGELTGETNSAAVYIISAHLDDLPAGPLAPGADDNASGSVAVMVASDILSRYRWDCTLRFAFWTGEEDGMLGSAKYAARARSKAENILGVLNLDMIGWNTPGSSPDIDINASSGLPASIELADQFVTVVKAYDLKLIPEVVLDVGGGSDHISFWDRDYTSILAMEDFYPNESDFNSYYHTTGDTLANLNITYFTEFVRAAVAETAHMAGCRTPGPEVSLAHSAGEVELRWSARPGDASYEVYRSRSAYFVPSSGVKLAVFDRPASGEAVYRDAGSGAGDTQINDFYIVRSLNSRGAASISTVTGEIDFALAPGG